MTDKKIDEKEAIELKKLYIHYYEKRDEIMENTSFKVEDVFCDITNKNSFPPD